MRLLKLTTFFALCLTAGTANLFAHYTLKDVINADKRIAQHKPSLYIAPVSGEFIKIKGEWYQVRLFSFEARPDTSDKIPAIEFEKFIEQHHQGAIKPKAGPETLYPTDYFASTPEMKAAKFNYLLSLRKVEELAKIAALNGSSLQK